jgi:hypothetical protein
MDRNDCTPAVLITATVCLMTAGLVWLVAPWGPRRARDAGDTIPRRGYRHEVVVWTGEVAPGLKGVLGPVWGDPKPDRDHDGILNRDLGLEGANALAYFRLLVFNTSNEPRVLELGNGRLVMTGEDGARSLPLRSLAAMVTAGEVTVDARLRFTLHSLGALSPRLEIPPGEFVKLVVPFAGDARIERARTIVTAQGTVLRRVELARAVFRHLMESPDEARVKDL